MRPRPTLLLISAVFLLLAACERPLIDASKPIIEVLEPDFSTVFLEDNALLRLRVSSFRDITRVTIGEVPLSFTPQSGVWEAPLHFSRGLNIVMVTALDEQGASQSDTLFALHLPISNITGAPRLDEPLGGHTATLYPTGELLLTGGARAAGGAAVDQAALLRPNTTRFEPLPATLHTARTGHTATLLPDGRLLLLGGSRCDEPSEIEDLVETAELYNPITRTFSTIPVEGPPIRRTLHTALLRLTSDGPVVDLLGGRGDIRYTPTSLMGTRPDLRSFLLVRDTLFALSPAIGPFIEPLAGHTQTALTQVDTGIVGRFLVTNSFFIDGFDDTTSFILDYEGDFGLIQRPVARPNLSRTRHAAVLLRGGFVALFGGHRALTTDVLSVPEIYVDRADRFFQFPENTTTLHHNRYGHTATKLSADRILLVGGFTPDGTGAAVSEYFHFTF